MGKRLLVFGMVAMSMLARAGAARAQTLPPTLPLNGTVGADTCLENPNDPCDSTVYPSPIATSRFTLDEPSTVNFMISGTTGGFQPALYLSGDNCGEGGCGPSLPAGSYCVTVTASEQSAIGSCGYFMLMVQTTAGEWIFGAGFDD